ncbi:hypothetical protein [Sorangium sp. So ce394]|uniref:hypothetical protein n=1 Tax=Sorangium sp. So ce394 TaxID=3133310 RepID=UPI003F5B8569
MSAGEPELGLAEYAALCAELAALPEQRERMLRRHGLADEEALAALEQRWRTVLQRDAELMKDFERLEAHHARRLEMLLARARGVADVERSMAPRTASSARSTPPPREVTVGPMAPVVTPKALQGTGPLLDVPRGAVVPFVPARGELAILKAKPKPARAAESLTGTAPLPDSPRGAALPFPQSSVSAAVKHSRPVIGETGPLMDIPRGPALPFTTGASGPPAPSTPTASPQPPQAPWNVVKTSPVQSPPRGPVVPFAAAEHTRAAGAAVTSRPTAQARAELGETSLSLAIPRELLQQAAYAPTSGAGTTSPQSPAPQLPAPSSNPGSGDPAPLREPIETILPLAQYAALCAELALFPKAAEEIFERYGLGFVEKRSAVDAGWKERFRERPDEYARWQDLYRRYHAHFATRGAPAG